MQVAFCAAHCGTVFGRAPRCRVDAQKARRRGRVSCDLHRRGEGLRESDLVKANGVAKDAEAITRRNLLIGLGVTVGVAVLAAIPTTPPIDNEQSPAAPPQPSVGSALGRGNDLSAATETDVDLLARTIRVAEALRLIEASLQEAELSAQQSCVQAARVRANYNVDATLRALTAQGGARQPQLAALATQVREALNQLAGYFDQRELAADSISSASIRIRQEQLRVISGALVSTAVLLDRFVTDFPARDSVAKARRIVQDEQTEIATGQVDES